MNFEKLEAAYNLIRSKWTALEPRAVLICGSGWSRVAEAFDIEGALAYEEIPGLGRPAVVGHAGALTWARRNDQHVLIFQGRRHYYEGEGWTPIALPIYIALRLGARQLVLTNSAGCMRPDLKPGDLMMLTDHINMMGANPLVGPHHDVWGPRFPDQSHVYTPALQHGLRRAAEKTDVPLHEGIYLAASGPTYESPAEVRNFKSMGADAVGMSTVPEAILASAAGLQVAGLSCMTNYAAGLSSQSLTHEEVTETTSATMPSMVALLSALWDELPGIETPS